MQLAQTHLLLSTIEIDDEDAIAAFSAGGQALREALVVDPGESFRVSKRLGSHTEIIWFCEGNEEIREQLLTMGELDGDGSESDWSGRSGDEGRDGVEGGDGAAE